MLALERISTMWRCVAYSLVCGTLFVPSASSKSLTIEPVSSIDGIVQTPLNQPQFASRRLIDAGLAYPSDIKLRAGVLHAPPFAIVDWNASTSTFSFDGFQPDLLDRLVEFAKQDNVSLSFELSVAPPQYGAALDLVANDCNTTANPKSQEDCDTYDLIVGDYYTNKDRVMRIDFTPAWLYTTMSTIKYTNKTFTKDYTTLSEVERADGTICVPDGTYLMTVVMAKFPKANYNKCPTASDCLVELQAERCSLYVDDELALRYRATLDTTLEVTREKFNSQYMTWPMSYLSMKPVERLLIKRWMYAAVSNTTLDQLYSKYFKKLLCPVGTAGENCDKKCDPNHGTSNADGVCVCSSAKWTGDDCSIEVLENRNELSTGLKTVAYVMFGINVIIIFGCAIWLYWKRDTPQVQVSQPLFLLLVLLGCFVSSSTLITFANEESNIACMATPWLYGLGFAITFGTMFAKIRRVYIIFVSAAQCKRKTVTNLETISIVAIVVGVYVILLTVWSILDPVFWDRNVVQADVYGEPLESVGYCTCERWKIWASIFVTLNLVVMCVACVFCYKARNIPTRFSEGKHLVRAG